MQRMPDAQKRSIEDSKAVFFQRSDLRITITYGIVAVLWIVFSDTLLSRLIIGNQLLLISGELVKGLAFVGITTLALFTVLSAEYRKRQLIEQALKDDIRERQLTETALRESEERYRRIIETTCEGIFVADADNRTVFVNGRMAEMLGCTTQEMMDTPLLTYVHPAEQATAVQNLRNLQQGKNLQIEIRLRRKDRSEFWAMVKANSFFDDKSQYTGALAMVTDITAHKQATEQQLESERLKAELNKEKEVAELKERFTSMVSHEFRNPLASIILACQLLKEYPDHLGSEVNLRKLTQIQTAAQRMTDLLEDVLTLSGNRACVLDTVILDLERLSQEIVTQLQPANHNLVFTTQGQVQNLLMDEKHIRHILTNLLTNAIKYSPEGSEVRFEVCREQDEIVFRIQDQGIGIPLEDQKRLFEPFHRAKNARKIPGTGLGLAIVKESVEKCGGTISLESSENKGTTFQVRLPV